MAITTASAIISLVRKLETESAAFYTELARRFPQGSEVFLAFAKENDKNIKQVERAYYSVITDAIEGCFAFDLDEKDWVLDATPAEGESYQDAVAKALRIEQKITKFYTDAAEQSKGLMADVPKAFVAIAKKRSDRIAKLESLLSR